MAALVKIAWTFFKIGLVFVGGGYVLIPLLHRTMVDQFHWLTLKEFLDGVALSQLTPGPLAIIATFAGFRVGGFVGALVGTVCIFIPCTALMLFLTRRYEKLRNVKMIREILDGVVPAVVGLVTAAAWNLGSTSLVSPRDFALLAASFLLLQFTKVSPMFVILGAGALGYFFNFS
ncbi:chromate transporter [Geobacter pickeringii]|uniref:Chromate transporter n=1 Tax=Geobacter pickeringii TaxID=345632 RepID=A0A0B5BBF6_9BACT|nr:chromate transporter [Geobacter pickeringii]AJE03862.1 chromate transporter [Geobacter pickeringii]